MPKVEVYSLKPGSLTEEEKDLIKNLLSGEVARQLSTSKSQLRKEQVRFRFIEGDPGDYSGYDFEIEVKSGFQEEREQRKSEIRDKTAEILKGVIAR